jgi:predicted Zn finger-like uncharacterized protein
MAEVFLNCPQCQRQLRVTDELIGRPVKCPACGFTFTVAPGSGEPQALPAIPSGPAAPTSPHRTEPFQQPAADDWEHRQPYDPRASSALTAPALCLLVTAILAFALDLGGALLFAIRPDMLKKQLDIFNPGGPDVPAQLPIALNIAFAALSLVLILGSTQMLRMKMYPVAIATCLLSMVNLENVCCCAGIPFGIWGLVILLRPEVRDAFGRTEDHPV